MPTLTALCVDLWPVVTPPFSEVKGENADLCLKFLHRQVIYIKFAS